MLLRKKHKPSYKTCEGNLMTAVYWNMKGLLLLMVTDWKALHFKIRMLCFFVVKVGKGEKHGEIRNNKKRKIEDSEN
jgi:hypothetical protein